jgi:hypothetical protein
MAANLVVSKAGPNRTLHGGYPGPGKGHVVRTDG